MGKQHKRQVNDFTQSLRESSVDAESPRDFIARYRVHDRRYNEEFEDLVQCYEEDVKKWGYTLIPAHSSLTGEIVTYFPKAGKEGAA